MIAQTGQGFGHALISGAFLIEAGWRVCHTAFMPAQRLSGHPILAIETYQRCDLDKSGCLLIIILMIICICRKINEQGVRSAVEAGARSPEAVQAFHGCQFNCGKCRCAMDEVIVNTIKAEPDPAFLVAAE